MYDRGVQKSLNKYVIAFLVLLYLTTAVVFTYEVSGNPIENTDWDTFLIMGYCKAAITFVKYLPQVYLNFTRKSVVGFSLANILLDLTGGSLSMLQIWLNA